MKSLFGATALLALAAICDAATVLRPREAASCTVDAVSCSSSSSSSDSCCVPKYGLMLLVQQWIPGYGPSTAWTLHGLWSDTCDGGIPGNGDSGCDSSRNYDNVGSIIQDGNSSLYDEMNTYWPSYSGSNSNFWTHEWNKHGTCVTTYDPECYGSDYTKYQDVYDYFGKALDLRSNYDLYSILKDASITPGDSYSVSDIEQAISAATGATPKVTCKDGQIEEIWLYFYVKGNGEYVPTDATSGSSCSGNTEYPTK